MKISPKNRSLLFGTALASGLVCVIAAPQARAQVLPSGGTVVTGDAVIGAQVPSPPGDSITVDLNATNSVINWTTFSIGNNDTVNFVSTNPNSGPNPTGTNTSLVAVLNRVIGFDHDANGATPDRFFPSIIDGTLNSSNGGNNNIAVWLVNPAGITFSSGATYNGGSLVLSTLDVPDSEFPGTVSPTFSVYSGSNTFDAAATRSVRILEDLTTSGTLKDIVLIGQAVTIGNGGGADNVTASRNVSVIAANSVTFGAGIGSPLSFTVNTGSTLASAQLQLVGSARVSGQSVTLVGVSQAAAIATMLQVDSGAQITATADSGGITLATRSTGTVTVTAPNANDSLNYAGGGSGELTLATGGSADGTIRLASAGALTINGDIAATDGSNKLIAEGATISLANAAVTTGGTQSYTGALTLSGSDKTLTGSTVTLASAVDSDGTARSLDITGNAVLGGTVGATNALTTLSVSGSSAINGASVTTTGTQTYTGAATLGSGAHTLTAPTVVFGSTLDGPGGLTIGTDVSFGGAVGGTTRLDSLSVGGVVTSTGLSVRTVNDQTYTSNLVLAGDASFDSTSGTVRFVGTVDSDGTARALGVTGNARFDSDVGVTDALASIAVSGASTINAAAITTTGNQTYTGAATISAATATFTGGTIGFGGTLNGAVADASALVVTGNASFGGSVGTTTRLTTIDVSGDTTINGAAITTQGNQTYTGAATLGSGLHTLTAPLVTFSSTLDGSGGLALSAAGTFTGAIGGTTRLASLLVPGALTLTVPTVRTAGDQTFGTALVLAADSTFDSTSGTVRFQSTVNSDGTARQLTVTGNARFDAAVGNTADLASLSVSGATALNGGQVDTVAGQTYTGAVTLGANTTLTSTTPGIVEFGSTVNSDATTRNLTVNADTNFIGALGGTAALGTVTISAASQLTTAAITANGTITLDAGGSIVTGALTANGATSDVLINQTVGVPGTASIGGSSAGRDYRLRATTVNLAGTQGAVGTFDVTSTTGAITGAASLAVTAGTIVLDSATGIALNIASSLNAGAGDVRVRNADLANVALGNVTAGALVAADVAPGHGALLGTFGNVAGTRITDLTMGTVTIPTASFNVVGDLLIGAINSSTITLVANDVTINSKLVGTGDIAITSSGNVQLAAFDSGADTGLIRSTGGNVTINAAGSVSGIGEPVNTVAATGGFDGFGATGNLTVNSTGDVEVGSLSAGGNLVLGIAGALLGSTATAGTAIPGGAIIANGATGQITVNAGTALAGTNDIVQLNRVEATSAVTLRGDQVAVGTLVGDATLTIESPLNVALGSANFYVGLRTFVGDATVNLGGVPTLTDLLATENITGPGVYGVETLFAGRNAADLSSGGSISGNVAAGAQLDDVNAGTSISLTSGALVARTLTSGTGATSYTVSSGTLSVHTATAGTALTLTKNGSGIGTSGNELRLVSGSALNGQANLTSAAQLRVGTLTGTQRSVGIAGGDLTGLREFGQAIVATINPVTNVATPTRLTGNYGAANFTSSGGQAGAQANSGSVQVGTVSGAGAVFSGVFAFGGGLTVDTLTSSSSAIQAQATGGTLYVGTGSAATTAAFDKTGAITTADGDDLRIGSYTAGGTITVNGLAGRVGHVRIGSLTSTSGNVIVNSAGDISGFRTALTTDPGYTAAEIPLGDIAVSTATTTANRFPGGRYGAATFTANGAAGNVTLTANSGSVQALTVSAGVNVTANARAMAIDTATATAGALALTASTGTLHLGTGTSGTTATLTKQLGSAATDGDELRVTSLTGATGATLNSSTHLRATSVTASTGDLAVTAGGDITGLKAAAVADATPAIASLVTTGTVLDADYGNAGFTATTGNAQITATSGGVQIGTAEATAGNLDIDAGALTAVTATAGGTLDLTATTGTLALGTGTAGATATLTKQAGSAAINGDDLRVTSLTGATGVTVLSNTSLRAGTITATTGDTSATATTGDVSGLLSGTFERLPIVTTGTSLSGNYGLGGISATAGNVTVNAASGGVQLGAITGGGDYTVSARAVSGGVANPTGALSITATAGTLVLTSAAGSSVSLVKQNGSTATDGDEIRVPIANSAGLVSLVSSTSVRVDTATSTGNSVILTATGGDITGIRTGAFAALPTVQAGNATGSALSADYGRTSVSAGPAGSATLTAGNGAQFDTVSTGTSISGTAAGLSVGTATAGTSLSLTANSGTLSLGSGTAGTAATLTKLGGSTLADGNDLRLGSLTAQTGVTLASATHIRAGSATATTGNLSTTATSGDITGTGTGAFAASIPQVSLTGALSAAYGSAALSATAGNVVAAAASGSVQASTTSGGLTDIDARAAALATAAAGGLLDVTATNGTLVLGTGTAASAVLTKQGGSAATPGDELRITSLTTSGAQQLTSSTAIRAGTLTSSGGAVTFAANGGDFTGLAGASAGTSDAAFGRGAVSGNLGVTGTASGLIQSAAVGAAAGNISLTAGSATADGALDIASASASGTVTLTATAVAPFSAATRDGDIRTGALSGSTITLNNTASGGTSGLVEVNGPVTATGNVGVTSATSAGLLDSVTTNGDYAVTAAGNITLGGSSAAAQAARGAVSITSTGGSIGQGSGALTLTANSDGVGTEALTLAANGNIALGNTALVGGDGARQSVIGLTATTGTATVGTASGARFASTSATGFTANGLVIAGNAANPADALAGPATVDIVAGSGAINTQAITATDSGHDIHLGTTGAITTGALTAARSVRIDGGTPATQAASLTAPSITATTGTADLRAGTITVPGGAIIAANLSLTISGAASLGSVSTTGTLTANGGSITADSLTSGGDMSVTAAALTVTGAASSGAAMNLAISGAASLGSASSVGAMTTNAASLTSGSLSSGSDMSVTGGALTVTGAATSGGGLAVNTTGATQLGSASSVGAMAITASTLNISGTAQSGGTMGLTTTGAMQLADVISGGVMTITAGTLDAASLASANSMAVTATDIDVTGLVSSVGAMTLAAGSGPIALGSASSGSGMTASGGSIAIAGPTTVTGTANLTATTGAISLGAVTAGQLVATARTGFTASGAIAGGNASLSADAVAGPATVDVVVTNGGITTGAITTSGAGHDIHLGASGAIATAALSATRSVRIDGGTPASAAASFTAPSVTATSGTLDIRSGTATVSGAVTSGDAMTLTTTGAASMGSATSGGSLTANTASLTSGALSSTGAMALTGGTVSVTGATSSGSTLAITTTGATQLGSSNSTGTTNVSASTLTVTGAIGSGGAMTLATTGATMLGSATSGGSLTANAASLTSGALSSTGAMALTAGTVNVSGATTSGSTLAITTTGATQLGSSSSTGATTVSASTLGVTGAATSGGAMTVTTTGATTLGSASAAGALGITANAVTVTGAANSTGSSVAITAGSGPVALGSSSAGSTMAVTGGSIAISGLANAGGTMNLDATGTTLNVGSITANGAVTLAARTRATLGTVGAGANAVTLTAADADVNGAVTASRITVSNRGPAGNDFRIGTGAAGTGGFELTSAEVNRLGAATVILDAGTGTGATRQDTSIGTLDLTNAAVRNLEVHSLQRIDLTGNLTRGSGSGLELLRLGGTATASDLAAVLRIAAKTDGTGGLINVGSARVELRSAIIGAGFDLGFLDQLGVIEGGVPSGVTAWTPADMVGNGASSLYNAAAFSGLLYQPGAQHVTASSMTVRYSNFALFQNTGVFGSNDGVALGTAAAPSVPALTISGPNPPDGGPFGIFGKLNGVADTAAALLGPSVISVTAVDRTTARLNGCLIGSGAGCLTTLTLTPSIGNIDPVRANIFFPNADFLVPFDPLVGTNNDSLFGDVGTFGLGDIPLAPIECAEGDTSAACTQQKEGVK